MRVFLGKKKEKVVEFFNEDSDSDYIEANEDSDSDDIEVFGDLYVFSESFNIVV